MFPSHYGSTVHGKSSCRRGLGTAADSKTHDTQHSTTIHNMQNVTQHATRDAQQATQHTTRSTQRNTQHNRQHSIRNTTHNTQHATQHAKQHTTRSTQHATHNTQHTTHNRKPPAAPRHMTALLSLLLLDTCLRCLFADICPRGESDADRQSGHCLG